MPDGLYINIPAKQLAHKSSGYGDSAQHASNTSAQSSKKYLVIKEWGVKAAYTSSSDTLSYPMSDDKSLATMITSKLATAMGCTDSGGGYISRLTAGDQAVGYPPDTDPWPKVSADAQTNPGKYVHIGKYFYYYETEHESACGNEANLPPTNLKAQEDQFVSTVAAKLVADN